MMKTTMNKDQEEGTGADPCGTGLAAVLQAEAESWTAATVAATTRRTEDAKGPARQVIAGAEATTCLARSNLVRPGYAAIQWWSSTAPSSPSRRQIKTTPRTPVHCSTSWRSTLTQCSMRHPLADRRTPLTPLCHHQLPLCLYFPLLQGKMSRLRRREGHSKRWTPSLQRSPPHPRPAVASPSTGG